MSGIDPIAQATDRQRAKAAKRSRAVAFARELMERGAGRCEAARIAGAELGASRDSVLRWMDRASASDGAVAALLDGRCNGPGRPPIAWNAPGAEQAFAIWRQDYMRLEKPGATACWRRLVKIAGVRGWAIPNVKTFLRRLRQETPRADIVFARQGFIAALKLFPHQVRTVAGMLPLDCVNGDGKKWDVFVLMPDGRVIRPVTWAWQDVRTRKILGWRTGETESADLVRLAFVKVVDDYGVPRRLVVDNTRAASAKWWSAKNNRRWRSDEEFLPGIIDLLGVAVSHTGVDRTVTGKGVGRGQSKPVERAFLDLAEGIEKHPQCKGAYTGNNPNAKPENYAERAVPWETWLAVIADGIAEYNARPGRRMEAADGRSIDETWAAEIDSVPVRRLSQKQRALLLLACESTQLKPDGSFTLSAGKGVGLPANRYCHEDLREFGWRRPENRKVVARFDPDDLHAGVQVFDLQGKWLCFAECLLPVGFRDTAGAREHGRARGQYKRALSRAAQARDRVEDLVDAHSIEPIAAGPGAKPKVVELVHPEGIDKAAQAEIANEREDRFARAALKAVGCDSEPTRSDAEREERYVRGLRRLMGEE